MVAKDDIDRILRQRFDEVKKKGEFKSFGKRRYGYAGAVRPIDAKEYRRRHGGNWYIRLVPIRKGKRLIGYHIWLGGSK